MENFPGSDTVCARLANFYIGNGLELDILISRKGLESFSFDECLSHAKVAEVEKVKVPFLPINHLIANKRLLTARKPSST